MVNNLKYKRYNDFKLFKQFLMDNGCYHSYMFNALKRNSDTISHLFDYITSKSAYCYVNGAFTWGFTKEGYDYWYIISQKWGELISKLYIKT